jgi:hypothetical protein
MRSSLPLDRRGGRRRPAFQVIGEGPLHLYGYHVSEADVIPGEMHFAITARLPRPTRQPGFGLFSLHQHFHAAADHFAVQFARDALLSCL